jgi:hypothetical protein
MPFPPGWCGLSRRSARIVPCDGAPKCLAIALVAVIAGAGCRRHAEKVSDPPNPSPATLPVATTVPVVAMAQAPAVRGVDTSSRTFANAAGGVRLTYPPGWQPTPSDDFILMLRPVDESAGARLDGNSESRGATTLPWGERFISLDMPDLPPHVPGFLPLNMVRDGYVDDVRKFAHGAMVQNLSPPTVPPGAKGALVRISWPRSSPAYVETALVMTRSDHVYILRARSRAADEPATRAAFDQIVQSLRFGK